MDIKHQDNQKLRIASSKNMFKLIPMFEWGDMYKEERARMAGIY